MEKPTATLKRLLKDVETELFRNWDDTGNEVAVVSMHFCNTSNAAVDVWISCVELSGLFINGALFSQFTVAANSSEYKEIPRRVLAVDESIRGYASVADVIAFSADLSGVTEDLIPPEALP